jgi:hypothetical protein
LNLTSLVGNELIKVGRSEVTAWTLAAPTNDDVFQVATGDVNIERLD